jgi:hypothetical protein
MYTLTSLSTKVHTDLIIHKCTHWPLYPRRCTLTSLSINGHTDLFIQECTQWPLYLWMYTLTSLSMYRMYTLTSLSMKVEMYISMPWPCSQLHTCKNKKQGFNTICSWLHPGLRRDALYDKKKKFRVKDTYAIAVSKYTVAVFHSYCKCAIVTRYCL